MLGRSIYFRGLSTKHEKWDGTRISGTTARVHFEQKCHLASFEHGRDGDSGSDDGLAPVAFHSPTPRVLFVSRTAPSCPTPAASGLFSASSPLWARRLHESPAAVDTPRFSVMILIIMSNNNDNIIIMIMIIIIITLGRPPRSLPPRWVARRGSASQRSASERSHPQFGYLNNLLQKLCSHLLKPLMTFRPF